MVESPKGYPVDRRGGIHNNAQFIRYYSQLNQFVDRPLRGGSGEIVKNSEQRRFYFHDCRNLLSPVRGSMWIPPSTEVFQPGEIDEIKKVQTLSSQLMERMAKEKTDCLEKNKTDSQALKPFFLSKLFKKYQESSSYLSNPEMRKISSYIPTALDLNEAYMDAITFFIHPNEMYLDRLKKGSIRAVDVLKKMPVKMEDKERSAVEGIDITPILTVKDGDIHYEWETGADNIVLNKAEAFIVYSVINKFTYKDGSLSRVILREDGSMEFVGNKGYEKNLRLDRYAEGMEREKPTRRQLIGDDPDFSQGLYAAELLGYAIGKDIVYRINQGGTPSIIIRSAPSSK